MRMKETLLKIYDERITHHLFKKEYGIKLKKIKDIHDGRCFIIGNGPSLKAEDLDLIAGEISFASNQIYKIYNQTKWRPTYYVNSDLGVLTKMIEDEEFWNTTYSKCFFQYNARFKFNKNLPTNSLYYYLREAKDYNKFPRFSKNIVNEIYDASTVSYIMLQICIYMGFKEIILLGFDHNYSQSVDLRGNMITNSTLVDHFFGNHSYEKIGGQPANLERMNMGFVSSLKYAKKNNIVIYNATRGGNLNVFERKSLKEVLFEE